MAKNLKRKQTEELFHPKELTRVRKVSKKYDSTYEYACNACPRRYKEKKQLNFHIQTMLRKNLFRCDICSETFYRKYHLNRHIKKSCSQINSSGETERTNVINSINNNAVTSTNTCDNLTGTIDMSSLQDDTCSEHLIIDGKVFPFLPRI